VARRPKAAASALADELDAGQSSRARLSAAVMAHTIGICFVEWIFMCTSSLLASEWLSNHTNTNLTRASMENAMNVRNGYEWTARHYVDAVGMH
jgi:hypothetical protein